MRVECRYGTTVTVTSTPAEYGVKSPLRTHLGFVVAFGRKVPPLKQLHSVEEGEV